MIFFIFSMTACPHKPELSYKTKKKSNFDKIKKYSIHLGLNSGPIASQTCYSEFIKKICCSSYQLNTVNVVVKSLVCDATGPEFDPGWMLQRFLQKNSWGNFLSDHLRWPGSSSSNIPQLSMLSRTTNSEIIPWVDRSKRYPPHVLGLIQFSVTFFISVDLYEKGMKEDRTQDMRMFQYSTNT